MNQMEMTLYTQYQQDPDTLHRQMNLQNLLVLCQLGEVTENEVIMQIIGSLVATFIDQNHAQLTEYLPLYRFAWITINRMKTTQLAVYHFLGSIVANIIFHFYSQLPSELFGQEIINLMQTNPQAGFRVLETVIARFRPPHRLHKEAIITLESQHRTIKNQFYKHNLHLLLQMIQNIFINDQQFLSLVDPCIDFFQLILETEFVTDTKEKDWHKMKRAEIKNNRSLESQIKEFRSLMLDQETIEQMVANSHIEWLDPTRSDIKKIWSHIWNTDFIGCLLRLLDTHSKLWGILGKICKIFKKHFLHEPRTMELVRQITTYLQSRAIVSPQLSQFLKFSCRTLFVDQSDQWIQYNLLAIEKTGTNDSLVYGLRFLRDLCRFSRAFDYSQLHFILMPMVCNYFQQWVLRNPLQDQHIIKNVRYNIKVISHYMIEQYLQYFADRVQNSTDIQERVQAFDYYCLGLFGSMKATSYTLDVVNKLQFYRKEQFAYPMDQATFARWNYKQLYRSAIEFGLNWAPLIEQQTSVQSKFYYKFWKFCFDPDNLIRMDEILQSLDPLLIFDFQKIFKYPDDLIKKCLKTLINCKIRFQDGVITCNGVTISTQCLQIFQQIQSNHLLFYSIKTLLVNAENESITNEELSHSLLNDYTLKFHNLIQSTKPDFRLELCKSILDEKGRCTYNSVMNLFWEQQFYGLFDQISLAHIGLVRKMINSDLVNSLRSEIIDSLLEYILKLSVAYRDHLGQQFDNFSKERQLGQKIEKQLYQLYYKPIIQLLKLYENLKHLNKCTTSKGFLKQEIYRVIFDVFKLINLNDISNYIHKMEPLYLVCQWLLQFESPRKMMPNETVHQILDFFHTALQLQERKTTSLVLKSIYDFLAYTDLVNRQQDQVKFVIENSLISAFTYNMRVRETGNIILRYIFSHPDQLYLLFNSVKQRIISIKTSNWSVLYDQYLAKLMQCVPKLITTDSEKRFADSFLQFQMFYNYYP